MRLAIATLAGALLLGPLAARAGDYPGLLQPLHDVTLSSGVGGVVASRRVRPGSQVRAGQVLMVLDDRLQSVEAERRRVILDDTSELKATEERLRISRGLYEDAKKVFEKTGSISRDELARLEAEYLATQGRLEQLQAQKKRERLEQQGAQQEQQMRQLVAPVAGVVTKVDIEPGEFAKAGEPLVRLVDASTLVFKANLPMAAVGNLKPGAVVPVLVEDGAQVARVVARLTFVSPVADAASGLVEVRARIANPHNRLRAGSKALLHLASGRGVEGRLPCSATPWRPRGCSSTTCARWCARCTSCAARRWTRPTGRRSASCSRRCTSCARGRFTSASTPSGNAGSSAITPRFDQRSGAEASVGASRSSPSAAPSAFS